MLVYENLVNYENGEIVPGLAERWEFSDDGCTLTFYLRPGVTFHDGTPCDAEAVKANLEHKQSNPSFYTLKAVTDIESMETVDDTTLVIHYTHPYFAYLNDFCWNDVMTICAPSLLIEGDFSKATDNLQYMRKFLYRLQSLTDTNELEWDRISISDVNEDLRSESPGLPIIVSMDKATNAEAKTTFYQGNEVSASIHGKNKIHSVGVDAEPAWVTNSGFTTSLGNGTDVYIFPMCCSVRVDEEGNYEDVDYFDIYFGSWRITDGYEHCGDHVPEEAYVRHFEPVCNTFNTAQNLSGEVAALYQSILRHEYDLKISSSVRDTIARFLSPDDPDYLPF